MRKDMLSKTLVMGIIVLFIGVSFAGSSSNLSISKSQMLSFEGNILYVGGGGEGNYSKIQDAIDNASDGDTVFVYDDSSPYYEVLTIPIGINLIGENRETTIIDGSGNQHVIYLGVLETGTVRIEGFTIQNGKTIIKNYKCNNSIIKNNNIISGGDEGIYLEDSSYNIISNNYFSNLRYAAIFTPLFIIDDWDKIKKNRNNVIVNNVFNVKQYTICIYAGTYYNISNNLIERGTMGLNLIKNSIIKNNTIKADTSEGIAIGVAQGIDTGPVYCVNITVSDNNIKNCQTGIGISGYRHNVFNNNITNCWRGMILYSSNSHIYNNNFIGNNYGISGIGDNEFPNNNHIFGNNFLYNNRGISLRTWILRQVVYGKFGLISDNYFYKNNFIGNKLSNAQVTILVGKNYWEYDGYGNYWDDYNGVDDNGDGIGDSPYVIRESLFGENIDNYPLMESYGDVSNITVNQVKRVNSYNFLNRFLERFPLSDRSLNIGWWNLE